MCSPSFVAQSVRHRLPNGTGLPHCPHTLSGLSGRCVLLLTTAASGVPLVMAGRTPRITLIASTRLFAGSERLARFNMKRANAMYAESGTSVGARLCNKSKDTFGVATSSSFNFVALLLRLAYCFWLSQRPSRGCRYTHGAGLLLRCYALSNSSTHAEEKIDCDCSPEPNLSNAEDECQQGCRE
jgi:hypothetical protein